MPLTDGAAEVDFEAMSDADLDLVRWLVKHYPAGELAVAGVVRVLGVMYQARPAARQMIIAHVIALTDRMDHIDGTRNPEAATAESFPAGDLVRVGFSSYCEPCARSFVPVNDATGCHRQRCPGCGAEKPWPSSVS